MKGSWWKLLVIVLFAYCAVAYKELDGFDDEMDDDDDDDDDDEEPSPEVHLPGSRRGAATQQRAPIVNQQEVEDVVLETHLKDEPTTKAALSSAFDEWDEEEFEGIPPGNMAFNTFPRADELDPPVKKHRTGPPPQTNFVLEKCTIAFVVLYAINYLLGRQKNDRIAKAWASAFTGDGSIFDKNFALIGPGGTEATWGGTPLMKESPSEWKLYLSGRQYCQCAMATLSLHKRQDLYSYLWYLVSPEDDKLTIDVTMNPENMEKMVFLVAPTKIARSMVKEKKDLEHLATTFDSPIGSNRRWPMYKFAVLGETWDLANDLMPDSVVGSLLSEKAYAKYGKYLEHIYFSDDNADPEHKGNPKVLSFKFKLPPAQDMADLVKLIEIVPRYIDLVGHLRLSSSAKAKSDAIRAKVEAAAFKETLSSRQEAIWRKKAEKKEAEREAEANLSKEAIRKREIKERKQQLKKNQAKMKISKLK